MLEEQNNNVSLWPKFVSMISYPLNFHFHFHFTAFNYRLANTLTKDISHLY